MRVAIVGGAAMGSAVALFLRRLGGDGVEVVVLEPDPAYREASSARSAGSIRQQFSQALNIQMSRAGLQMIEHADHELSVDGAPVPLGFVPSGYLFLATASGAPTLRAGHAVQRAQGAPVALLSAQELDARFHWLYSDDIALASLGLAGEGWLDGEAYTRALARKARALGATYRQARVVGFERSPSAITAARLDDGTRLHADLFVNAAGPWAGKVAALAGVHLPVHARRRTVFMLDSPARLPRTPLVIDPSGTWFRSEGDGFLAGWSPGADDEDLDDLPLDPDLTQFDTHIWPALAHRVPAFEALRVRSAWAGYYEVHPLDHNGIVGPHPELSNLVFINGFSGHGLQHAAAAGRGLAEWIVFGAYRSLDLGVLSFERVSTGRPFVEQAVI